MTTFDVQLGAFKASYKAFETTAPVDYDGFGTITLHHHAPVDASHQTPRWVLVRVEHEQWQTMRYRSGMFPVESVDVEDMGSWTTERLYKRMLEGQDAER